MTETFLEMVSGFESTHLINSFLPCFSGNSTSSPLLLNLKYLFTGVNDFNPFSASYTNRRNATYTIGDHLDATEASDLYDALTTFNTSLSRQT